MSHKMASGAMKTTTVTGKRKRQAVENELSKGSKRIAKPDTIGNEEDIIRLEAEAVSSPDTRSETLARLIQHAAKVAKDHNAQTLSMVALCRVFCRLFAAGDMVKTANTAVEDSQRLKHLKAQYSTYVDLLTDQILTLASAEQSVPLTLLMRLVKQETRQEGRRGEQAWLSGTFPRLVESLARHISTENAAAEFVETYVEEHDDVRFHLYAVVARALSQDASQSHADGYATLLLKVQNVPDSAEQLEDWYGQTPAPKNTLLSLQAHRKQAEAAWLAIFRCPLSKERRKAILATLTDTIVPWFTKPERLMDFLTDCYDQGGATSLLALSGLFHLMQEMNLDYPQFFPKLYSLLDEDILHSKHRSRFFRLLEQFMTSTHLPATLVASFIKRLSRLALHAPPGGIVVVIPWVYNMLKRHPTCTFMIHREIRDTAQNRQIADKGMDDCFDMSETDPTKTNAIDSCLWELQTLQSHYHPNVATLAKIIGEQFTKRNYNLEDFLDHTYQGVSICIELTKYS